MRIWKVVTKFPPGMVIWKALPLELKHGDLDRKTCHGAWFFLPLHWWQPRTIESLTPWPGLLGASWIFVCCLFLSPLLGPLRKLWYRMDSTWWAFSTPALLMRWTQRLYCHGVSYALQDTNSTLGFFLPIRYQSCMPTYNQWIPQILPIVLW